MSEAGDLVDLLNQIKEHWPQFSITKENLLRPTREVVFRFYSNFVSECYDKIAHLTRCTTVDDTDTADLTPEERLFRQLSRLLIRIHSLRFTLLDIYLPNQKGTKHFFAICIHFLKFIDYLINETDSLGNYVFKTRDETIKYLIELEELLDIINENASSKSAIAEYNRDVLEPEYNSVKKSYKKMLELKAAKEKVYAEKENLIKSLKWELQNEQYDINRLEAREKDLRQQIVTENEYHNILQTLETLKIDSQMLDSVDVNIEDGLVIENEAMAHSAECNRILSQYDFNIRSVTELVNKEVEQKCIFNTREKLQTNKIAVEQQKLEAQQSLLKIKKDLSILQKDHKKLKETCTSNLLQFSKELDKIRNDTKEKFENNVKTILSFNEATVKLESDLEKLRNAFMHEYIRVSEAEQIVVNKFKNTLIKFARDIQ